MAVNDDVTTLCGLKRYHTLSASQCNHHTFWMFRLFKLGKAQVEFLKLAMAAFHAGELVTGSWLYACSLTDVEYSVTCAFPASTSQIGCSDNDLLSQQQSYSHNAPLIQGAQVWVS